MADYALTAGTMIRRTADGAFIPPDPANADYSAFLVWCEVEGNVPDPYVPPAPPAIRRITPLAWRRRFGDSERTMIAVVSVRALLQPVPDATLWNRVNDVMSATFVDLDNEDVQAGVDSLIAAGIVAPARKPVLLADGTPEEAA